MPSGSEIILAAGGHCRWWARVFCLIFLVVLVLARPQSSHAGLADYLQLPQYFPENDLVMVKGERPDWKKYWDNGRRLVRSGEYLEAVESYRRILAVRGNIEEVRWELAQIFTRLEEWDKARTELELLVEASPDNIDYLNVLGVALRHTGQSGRALELFSKVRGRNPENFTALVGEALGFMETGRKREALPLIQAIVAKNPDDRDLNLTLVSLAFELGQLETARKYLVPLTVSRKVDLDILVQAGRIHDGLGREKEGAVYWEKVLALDSGNREARERLIRYYEEAGQPDKVLVHLRALWDGEQKNVPLLSRICRMYIKAALFSEGRPFIEQYLQLRPDDLDFIRLLINNKSVSDADQIAFMRQLLAVNPGALEVLQGLLSELVAAGNLADAVSIWERVAVVVPERPEVYRALAPLLEKLGREKRLLEVLESIHRLVPGDQEVLASLARKRVARGELEEGLAYFNLLEQSGYNGADLYVDRSALYERLHQPMQVLRDYERLLIVAPDRNDIRRRSLRLAGELGAVQALTRLAGGVEKLVSGEERTRQTLLLANAYSLARDAIKAAGYYQTVMAAQDSSSAVAPATADADRHLDILHQARLGLADLYRRDGRVFEAEQVLREGLLAGEVGPGDLLSRLFDLALVAAVPDLDSAEVWLQQYALAHDANPSMHTIMQARLHAGQGKYAEAKVLLHGLLAGKSSAADRSDGIIHQAELSLADILIASGDPAAAEQQYLAMVPGTNDREVLAYLAKLYSEVGEPTAADKIIRQLTGPEDDDLRLLELAELFHQRGLWQGQLMVADKVWARWPESYRAGYLRAEALGGEGKTAEALAAIQVLREKFPESGALEVLAAQIDYQGGNYRQSAEQCKELLISQPGRLDIQLLRIRSEMALLNQGEATRLVQEQYPVAGSQYLKTLLVEAGLPVPPPRHPRSLWQILTFRSESFDLVSELLSARAFCEATPERRKINDLVLPQFARLLWEKNFRAAVAGAIDTNSGEGKLAKKK